jgi:copper chaperone CopZ
MKTGMRSLTLFFDFNFLVEIIMKYFILILLLTCITPAFADHDHDAHKNASVSGLQSGTVNPEGELITITASGLVCDFCAQAVEKVFMKKLAVSGIDVNLADKKITVSLNTGKTLSDAVIKDHILKSGYNLIDIHRSFPNTEAVNE